MSLYTSELRSHPSQEQICFCNPLLITLISQNLPTGLSAKTIHFRISLTGHSLAKRLLLRLKGISDLRMDLVTKLSSDSVTPTSASTTMSTSTLRGVQSAEAEGLHIT